LDGEVAKGSETGDAVTSGRVDGAGTEVVRCWELGERFAQSREDFGGAVVGVSFHNGDGAVFGPEKADHFNEGAEETG